MDERMKTCQWTERRKLSVCKNWAPEGRIVGNWKRWVWIGAVSGGQRGGLLVSKAASVTTWKQHFLRLWFLQRGGTFSLGGRREVLVHSSGSKSRRILHSLFFLFFSVFFAPPPPPHPALVFSGQRWPRAALFFCLWMWFVSTPQCRRRWLIPDILRGLPPRRRPLDRTFALFGRTPALRCWDFASH